MKNLILLLVWLFAGLPQAYAQFSVNTPVIVDIISDCGEEDDRNYCFDLSNNVFLEAQTFVIGGDIPDIFYLVAIRNGLPWFAFVDWKEKWMMAERGWMVVLEEDRYRLVIPNQEVPQKTKKEKKIKKRKNRK